MTYILDTNILCDSPQIIENKKEEDILIIPIGVLKELDGLKKNQNHELASHARRAAIMISRNIDKLIFDFKREEETVDGQVLEVARRRKGILVTNDIYLKILAIAAGVQTEGFTQKDNYTGVKYWFVDLSKENDKQEFDKASQTGEIPECLELCENEYLIVKDLNENWQIGDNEKEYKVIGTFICNNNKLNFIDKTTISNKWINTIKPKNCEQSCLFNSLNDRNKTIIYAGGQYGTG